MREKKKSPLAGTISVAVGAVRAAVVGMEDPPLFEMGDDSLDRSPQGRDLGVAFFVSLLSSSPDGFLRGVKTPPHP